MQCIAMQCVAMQANRFSSAIDFTCQTAVNIIHCFSKVRPMDFHAHQTKAESKSLEFVLYFFLAIAGTACVLWVPLLLLPEMPKHPLGRWLLSPSAFMWCFTISLIIIGISSLQKSRQLERAGGKFVAYACGASPVGAPADAQEQMLAEIVAELSSACKIKPPELYVIRHEPGINAFVAGHGEADTVMAVTRGALDDLTRDELKGVAAHEFSHITNGDMRLCTQLIAIICGVSSLSMFGRYVGMLGGLGRIFGLFLICGGMFGSVCAHAMQSSISRQRELLADACAVRATGSATGLAGALKKIAASSAGSTLSGDSASYFNHLMLSDCRGYRSNEWWVITSIKQTIFTLFASHPPLGERIRVLDPAFDGDLSQFAKPKKTEGDAPLQ